MTNGEITAASGVSLAESIAEMQAAGQPYSVVPGVVFAVAGGLLAIAWAAATLAPALSPSGWSALAVWAAILAFGAPAYFFASFGNMNAVGDTFYEWNAEAAFRLVVPLYLTSAVAALVAVIALATGAARSRSREPASGSPRR